MSCIKIPIELQEPKIHWIEDKLPDYHPNAFGMLDCIQCDEMLHGCNNEFMQPWVETGKGNYCLSCFNAVVTLFDGDEREFGLSV